MEERAYLTVTALNKYIEKKFILDPYLGEIYIKGEISNFKLHNNNNIYFSIKDENTRINAVWFGAKNRKFKDGDTVLIKSKINFFSIYLFNAVTVKYALSSNNFTSYLVEVSTIPFNTPLINL